jgi:hypothetical protein
MWFGISLRTLIYRRRIGTDYWRRMSGSDTVQYIPTRLRHHVEFGDFSDDAFHIYHPWPGRQYAFTATIAFVRDQLTIRKTRWWFYDPVKHCVRARDL